MKQQTNSQYSCFFKEKCRKINGNGKVGVKNMIINAASCRTKNWRCQQMIEIYQHCQNQYQPNIFPIFFKEIKSDYTGKQKVHSVMCAKSKNFQS